MIRSTLIFIFSFLFISAFSQTISAEATKDYIGKIVTVSGKVVDGRYLANTGRQPTLLNIDSAFPHQIFSIVIYGNDRKNFGYKPEEILLNKNVFVTGKIEMYKGKPQVTVTNPDQIVIATADMQATGKASTPTNVDITLKTLAKLKSGPGNNFKTIAKLKAGSVIKVLHTDNGWWYISVRRTVGKDDKNYSLMGFIKAVK